MGFPGDRLRVLRKTTLVGASHVSIFPFRLFGDVLPLFSPLASLLLHSQSREFLWIPLCVPRRLQLPPNICSQFSSFPCRWIELCNIPNRLCTLVSQKRAWENRSSFSQYRL